MAKKIEKLSIAKRDEKVAKLLAKRAERLQTKKYAKPEKFAEELAWSETQFKYRVEIDASKNFVKKVLQAFGLAITETTDYSNGGWEGVVERSGASIYAVSASKEGFGHERDNVWVTITLCDCESEYTYMAALKAAGIKRIGVRYADNKLMTASNKGWGAKTIDVVC